MSEEFIEAPGSDDIQSAELRNFLDIWEGLRRGEGTPLSKDFLLTDFAKHLPFMIQNDFDARTGRFFVRFLGSGYADGVGADYTNRFVDEIPRTDSLLERSRWLVENRKPYLILGTRVTWTPKDFKYISAIACPLFDEEECVSSVLFRIEVS